MSENKREMTNIETGLSTQEVLEQTKTGEINIVTNTPTKTTKDIIKTNSLTLFNGLNLVLAALVIIAGQPANAVFVFVIISNTFIGIFQELRAKRTLAKLAVLNTFYVEVLRDGTFLKLDATAIVVGDILKIETGNQIAIDGIIRANEAEVDESLLTGESDAVLKKTGDVVLAGSFLIAGSILVQATKVGDKMYASQLATEAKSFSMVDSQLMIAIRRIIKWITTIIIPVGLLLIGSQLLVAGITWQMAIVGAVAGIVGMIPEGLVLLTSIAFMVGVVRLAQHQTLVQELPAVEMLARVDTLCLDKTGTITEGYLNVKKLLPMNEWTITQMDEALAALSQNLPAANATQVALLNRYEVSDWKAKTIIPFSSSRKWSAIGFDTQGTWILGAPEMVITNNYERYREVIEQETNQGSRVLVLAYTPSLAKREMILDDVEVVGFIAFDDVVRASAPKTLEYFRQQGVDIKIISGDNPITVAAVAKQAGLIGTEHYLDARFLPEDMDELRQVVEETKIFGRVSPKQKQSIIEAMQLNGRTVAMTGDGVNDVLALKQSDCGIAMASGSEATRAVAQVVLLNSDFSSLPKVVSEGRKVINNIEQVASLYLVKTLYSMILSVIFILLMQTYPFLPVQLTFVSSLMVGIPSFFLALAPNDQRVSGKFLAKVLKDTIPGALSIVFFTMAIYVLIPFMNLSSVDRRTLSFLILGGIQFLILAKVAHPYNTLKYILIGLTAIVFCGSIFIPTVQAILMIGTMNVWYYILAIALVALAGLLILGLEKILVRFYQVYEKKQK